MTIKHIVFKFNPFVISSTKNKRIRTYNNVTSSSKKRLDKTLVNFCEKGQMIMCIYTDFKGHRMLSFEPVIND